MGASIPKSDFCFVGNFNCHQSEWLGSYITDAHSVAAFDFDTVADCSRLMDPFIGLVVCWILFWRMYRIYVMCVFKVMLGSSIMRLL